MATKVNRDYWDGTIYNMSGFPNADDVGYLDGQLADLITNDKWNITNNEEFDLSVCPWGLPQCSLSSLATPVFAKDEGNKVILSFEESNRRNMPFFLNRHTGRVKTDDYSVATARTDNKQRIVGDTAKSTSVSYNLRYTTDIDTTNVSSNYIASNTKPIVKLQYSAVRAWLGSIWYFDTLKYDNFSNVGFITADYTDFLNLKNTDATKWRYKVVRAGFAISSKLDSNTRINAHCCGKSNIPQYLQDQYYNNGTTEYIDLSREIRIIGQNVGQYPGYGNYGYVYFSDPSKYGNTLPTLKTTKSIDYGCSSNSTCICNASAKRQKFNDVSYHWEQHLYYYTTGTVGSGVRLELKNGEVLPFNTSKNVNPIITLEIDETIYDNYYDSALAALMHEAAFLGLPFCKSFDDINNNLSDTTCFIPVFDYDHMITTGEYKRGDQASDLPNFTWGDIFDTSVPAYDPSYIPPEPEPDQGDTGDLNNQQLHNLRYDGSNNYYLLTESELSQFIGFINGLYTGESDPEKKRSIDFMGSNPTDYIVGIYGCGIELTGGATTAIKLGAVDTSEAGIYGRAVPTNLTYVNFGDYDIPAYGNFLDFKPYTTIEVYVPLCGTIEVDPGEYIGHNLKVDGLIDYQTGELTARIVRDGKTVTNTLTGSMWVQLPVTAAKMGDYQNNQHQLRMQMLSSVLSFGQSSANAINSDVQSAAGAIAGSAAGGSPTALATPGKAQFTIPQNAASTALSLYNTHYQITHTQPARATASSASAGNALEMYHHAMIFIKRPTFLDGYNPDTYAHTIGHACCISAQLSSFSGYTVFSAADLDNIHTKRALDPLQATAQEKQLLKQALQSGIYINTISPE